MKNQKAKFTIIIPTRERCDTLKWSLKTCTEQNYDNLEIIVSDNHSRDLTRDVVDSFHDSRIRYMNTGKRLNMTHNFEFALSHATGDYITIIGDDDGMMINILDEMSGIMEDLQPSILTWNKANYMWPNYYDEHKRDVLNLPYRRKNRLKKVDSSALLNSICGFEKDFAKVLFMREYPAIYHSFVNSKTISKAKSKSGNFFHSINPDIYSGMALASVVPHFWHTTKSYSLRGASSHSIGAASFSGNRTLKSPAIKFINEENIPFHPQMMFCNSTAVLITECLLQTRDNVPNARRTDFDVKLLIDRALAESMQRPQNIYDGIVEAIRHIGKVYRVEDYADEAIRKNIYQFVPENASILYGYQPYTKSYTFNGKELGIDNVYEAALFCEKVSKESSLSMFVKQNYRFLSTAVTIRGLRKIAQVVRSDLGV